MEKLEGGGVTMIPVANPPVAPPFRSSARLPKIPSCPRHRIPPAREPEKPPNDKLGFQPFLFSLDGKDGRVPFACMPYHAIYAGQEKMDSHRGARHSFSVLLLFLPLLEQQEFASRSNVSRRHPRRTFPTTNPPRALTTRETICRCGTNP